jgi:hypothetical protein
LIDQPCDFAEEFIDHVVFIFHGTPLLPTKNPIARTLWGCAMPCEPR